MLGEMTDLEGEAFLQSESIGRIGCHAGGMTYVVPVLYVFRGGCVYGHSTEGRKIRTMRRNPEVCFEVDRVKGINDWRSVISWGRYEELTGDDGLDAMELLMKGLVRGPAVRSNHPSYPVRTAGARGPDSEGISIVVYRIRLTKTRGRFESP
ncbi:MAG: pyridoxamine 5'-phosphate oxidase family protein [Acidobacteriota bacterium]